MVPDAYPHLQRVIARQLAVFAEHADFLRGRFAGSEPGELAFADAMAQKIAAIAGGHLDEACEDYRWLCDVMLEEDLFFRRHGRYRLSSFAEALTNVYADAVFMRHYMNGLLLTHLWWRPHTHMLQFFRDVFLPANPPGFSHLEIGPGHGLLLHLAATAPHCGTVEAWDISAASIAATRAALDALGGARHAVLMLRDFAAAPDGRFQSIAFAEVLEHLEDPRAALAILRDLLAPGGRLYLSTPVNAPAPDHLHLFSTPEEIVEMVREAGFDIQQTLFAPATGVSLERARKRKMSISVALAATKRD
jgi:2-polyprenyl-3-methyl-5-hydroxy-6-metoxy-1,4-benzoquinol methylase